MDCVLIKDATILNPQPLGKGHLILARKGKILAILKDDGALNKIEPLCSDVFDAKGLVACPGFVDIHTHLIGGGGEKGFSSRTPEAQLSQILNAGITTIVGLLGTDSVSRSLEALIAKCRGLDPVTALFWTGSGYRYPAGSLTGSVQRDIALLESCVGAGEIAISDNRASFPTPHELARMAAEARVGGMLAGRPGLVHVHIGSGSGKLNPLREAIIASGGDLPASQFLPTHVDRNDALVEDGAKWLTEGGRVDLTCSNISCRRAIETYFAKGDLPMDRVTVSTDAFGSLPVFDGNGKLVGYDVGDPRDMQKFLASMCCPNDDESSSAEETETIYSLEQILPFMTCNAAKALGLSHKGHLSKGADADVVLLDPKTCEVKYVFAKGELVKTPEWVRGGMFEKGDNIRHPELHQA